MSKQQRIRKLCVGPSGPVNGKNSHVGMRVIADYVSDEDAQRYIVFERAAPSKETPPSPRKKRNSQQQELPALAPA